MIESQLNGSLGVANLGQHIVGEMHPAQLWDTTMNPETRTLTKITMDDAKREEYVQWMNKLLGNDIAGRKEYYRQYL